MEQETSPVNPPNLSERQESVDVGFPKRDTGSKGSFIKILILAGGVLLIIGIGTFIVFRGVSQSEPEPTPYSDTLGSIVNLPARPLPTATESSTPSPEPVKKNEVRINVLNGTGVAGEASFLQDELKDAAFENIKVGNAENQNETVTTLRFADSVPSSVKEEISSLLKKIFKTVVTREGFSSADFDIEITTGTRLGSTSSPSSTPTSTPSASPDSES